MSKRSKLLVDAYGHDYVRRQATWMTPARQTPARQTPARALGASGSSSGALGDSGPCDKTWWDYLPVFSQPNAQSTPTGGYGGSWYSFYNLSLQTSIRDKGVSCSDMREMNYDAKNSLLQFMFVPPQSASGSVDYLLYGTAYRVYIRQIGSGSSALSMQPLILLNPEDSCLYDVWGGYMKPFQWVDYWMDTYIFPADGSSRDGEPVSEGDEVLIATPPNSSTRKRYYLSWSSHGSGGHISGTMDSSKADKFNITSSAGGQAPATYDMQTLLTIMNPKTSCNAVNPGTASCPFCISSATPNLTYCGNGTNAPTAMPANYPCSGTWSDVPGTLPPPPGRLNYLAYCAGATLNSGETPMPGSFLCHPPYAQSANDGGPCASLPQCGMSLEVARLSK